MMSIGSLFGRVLACRWQSLLQTRRLLLNGTAPSVLRPTSVHRTPIRGYKIKHVLRLRCRYCYFIRVNGRLHVECKKHGRHKQMEPFNVKLLW